MNLYGSLLKLLVACALLGAAITPLSAQDAQIGGRVADPSDAVIPGTAMLITNTDTGLQRKTSSNYGGYYGFPQLPPGRYRLTAQKEGFRLLNRDGILLQVGDRLTLNLIMDIGATREAVTITAEIPLLRTEDAQQGLVVDNRRIMELPQYSRDPLAFAQLAPNVNGTANAAGYGSNFRIDGGRTNQVEYFQDGQPVTTGYKHDIPPSTPSKEAVAEFKVLTNGLSAEYGRLSGGAVVLVTRSGTNQFHGSVYEFFKNDRLNANAWNSNRLGRPKAIFHDNAFGFTFGGPVTIPKLYKGTDKTFFFLNYEGTRHVSGSNANQASVPTSLERQGDFSQSLYHAAGEQVQIFDPATGHLVNGQVVREPFPGNRIPEARFDPLAKIYLGFYPFPNQAPQVRTNNVNNYVYNSATPSSDNRWTGRLDQNWNHANSSHFTLTHYNYTATTPRTFSKLQAVGVNSKEAYTSSFEHNWIVTPTTVASFRAGVVRSLTFSGSLVDADASGWNLPGNVVNLLGGTNTGRVPSIGIVGITSLGGGTTTDSRDTSYTGSVAIQKMWGSHTFKAGYEHRRYYTNEIGGGDFSMSTEALVTAQEPAKAQVNGLALASFLLGAATGGSGKQIAGPASRQTYHGAYLQDDIKLTRKLTINAGIRWDLEPTRTERFDRQSFWDRDYTWNIQPDPGWSWSQVQQAVGKTMPEPIWLTQGIHGRVAVMGTPEYPGRTLHQAFYNHFGPRLGLAYQVLPRTVVRVSYGLMWMTTTGNFFLASARSNLGYGDAGRLAQGGTGDGGLTYPLTFSNPMPGNAGYIPLSLDVGLVNRAVMGNWFVSQTKDFTGGYEHNVQLAIQRELGSGANSWVFEIAYNGSLGRNLPTWLGRGEHILPDAYHKIGYLGKSLHQLVPNPFYNQIPAGTTRSGRNIPLGQLFQLNPLWSEITTLGDPYGTSNYNAGYIKVERRFAHGFGLLANYTLAKLMEDTGGVDSSTSGSARYGQAGLGFKDVYSLSTSDYRHKVVLNYSLEMPFGRGKRFLSGTDTLGARILDKIAGGWVAAGTTTIRSGTYLSISPPSTLWSIAGHAKNSGRSERPLFVYPRVQYNNNVSGHESLLGSANFIPYMNGAAFRLAQATPDLLEVGDVGQVLAGLPGPGFSQWDFALMKNFGLGSESRYFQLRFETQNLLNHMNSGNPGGDFTIASFGTVTAQSGSSRVAMVAAKLYF